MKSALLSASLLSLSVLAACGGKAPAPATPAAVTTSTTDATAKQEHPEMPPSLKEFHDVLAPHWHTESGMARVEATCGDIALYEARATVIQATPAPDGVDELAWTEAGEALSFSVDAVNVVCEDRNVESFDKAFDALHTDFHDLLDLSAGEKK